MCQVVKDAVVAQHQDNVCVACSSILCMVVSNRGRCQLYQFIVETSI